jgi:RNA polymerase sigma-70 factor (ECF subfamily)
MALISGHASQAVRADYVRDLGRILRGAFSDVSAAPLPAEFVALLQRLDVEAGAATHTDALPDAEFKQALAAVIPQLRAFGRSLSGSADTADDLVQETLMKAWAARARFVAGTNMRAWTFIILRNLYLSQRRRARFKGDWDETLATNLLAAPAEQDREIELADVQRALLQLPPPQREALMLVGAGGFSYEEAAEICRCAVGTIKSRVARGRAALETMIETGVLPSRRHDAAGGTAFASIMSEVDAITKA